MEPCYSGESADKKLARGDVPPFLLKSVEIGGPQTAFAFLKMWKLASHFHCYPGASGQLIYLLGGGSFIVGWTHLYRLLMLGLSQNRLRIS